MGKSKTSDPDPTQDPNLDPEDDDNDDLTLSVEDPEDDNDPKTSDDGKKPPDDDNDGEPSGGEPSDRLKDLMGELGLNNTYSDPEIALRAFAENQGTLTRAQQDNADLRRLLQNVTAKKSEDPQPSREELTEQFDVDPVGAIEKAGYVKKEDITPLHDEVQKLRAEQFCNNLANKIGSFEGLDDVADHARKSATDPRQALAFPVGQNKIWDKIATLYRGADPSIQNAEFTAVLPFLYYQATVGNTDKKPVNKIPNTKKNRANTSSGGSTGEPGGGAPDYSDVAKWPPEKMKADLKKRGLYEVT